METLKTKAIVAWDGRDYDTARSIFEQLLGVIGNDAGAKEDCLFNMAACLGAAGEFKQALEVLSTLTTSNDIIYNKALCHYKLSNFKEALKLADQLLAIHRKAYPDLSLRGNLEIQDSVLLDSCFIEALNLKFATLIRLAEPTLATQCLNEIPIKDLSQLDGVTLHNKALLDCDAASSIHKLAYLSTLGDESCPPETFGNLMILYLQSGQNRLAQEFLKANKERIASDLKQYFSICLDDSLQSDEQIYYALNKLLGQILSKNCDLKFSLAIVSHQAEILWLNNHYTLLENLLNKLKVHLKGEEQLKWLEKNMAHVIYMQDSRFEESLQLYEEQMAREADVDIVCNLCVSYVLTGRNGDAELLIKRIERESEEEEESEVGRLCQINLIIGTLYCVKYNYEFGLARMFKAVEPLDAHLNATTWWLIKRCLLSMLDLHCKQVICPKDDLFDQSIGFLIQCERWARTAPDDGYAGQGRRQQLRRLAYEARQVRSLLLSALHD